MSRIADQYMRLLALGSQTHRGTDQKFQLVLWRSPAAGICKPAPKAGEFTSEMNPIISAKITQGVMAYAIERKKPPTALATRLICSARPNIIN